MTTADSKQPLDLDTRILSEFIYALNIARRQVLAYPAGHPVIGAATGKLMDILPRLLEFRSELTIGIARDTLLVDGKAIGSTNAVFRDLARYLFGAKIASLTITNQLTAADVCRFFEIFQRQADQLTDAGGLSHILSTADIPGIRAQGIDFKAFKTTEVETIHAPKTKFIETESAVLWKSFIDGLVKGNLDPDGERFSAPEALDPDLLAEVLNQDVDDEGQAVAGSYEEAITAFLSQLDREKIRTTACRNTLGRLGDMVGKLKPELRRKFLNSTLRACSNRQEAAELMLGKVPQAAILDALEQLDAGALQIPQTLMDVLGKLATHRDREVSQRRVAGVSAGSAGETAEKLSKLFSTDRAQLYVPEDYQDSLAVLAAADPAPELDREEIVALVATLDGHRVEQQFCAVLLDLLDRDPAGETVAAISQNIEHLTEYFLETGDFFSLISTFDHLRQYLWSREGDGLTPEARALAAMSSTDFVSRVLDGLDTWGKPAYPGIKTLISKVGEPFVEPLLDRLAEEPEMSRRRLFLECLQVLGPAVREGAVARLHDRRWYFVRNLVVILRELNDPAVLMPLGRLVGYAHPKVQFEVMRTFLHYQDPRADRYLLRELDSRNPGVLLYAIKLAAKSRNPAVAGKLAGLLNAKLPAEHDEALKTQVINSLSETALAESLPELAKFLLSRSLLDLGRSTPLKLKAVAVLQKFASAEAMELADQVCRKSSGELARAAGQVYRQLNGKV